MTDKEYKCFFCSKELDMTKAVDVIGHLKGFTTKKVKCEFGKTTNISIARDVKKTVWKDVL